MRASKYLFIFVFLFSSLIPFYTFAFLPVIAAPLIETILGRIIASRVAAYVASGAAGAATAYAANKLSNDTISGFTRSLLSRAGDISSDSIYRVATGSLNWTAANYLYQNVPFQQYLNSGVSAITEGFEKAGQFFSYVNGKLVQLDFLPSLNSPYLYSTTDSPSDTTPISAKNFTDAIQQCSSIAPYVFSLGSGYFCSSSPEAAVHDLFLGDKPECDSITIESIDTTAGKIYYMCHRTYSYDYGKSRNFQSYPTTYQPPKDPDENPVLLPNKPVDLIKPSLNNPVSTADLAGLLNSLAQDAASLSDYQGVPFSPSTPITDQEIKNAIAGNGTAAQPALANPTVNDFLAPAQSGGASSPIAADVPSSAAIPSDTPSTSDNTKDDYKPDYSFPSTPQPYLETPPDGFTILKPLTSLLPFLKNFQFQSKSVDCPIYSFDFIGTTVTIDEHCHFFAKYGALIKSVCTAFWLFSALRIILSA